MLAGSCCRSVSMRQLQPSPLARPSTNHKPSTSTSTACLPHQPACRRAQSTSRPAHVILMLVSLTCGTASPHVASGCAGAQSKSPRARRKCGQNLLTCVAPSHLSQRSKPCEGAPSCVMDLARVDAPDCCPSLPQAREVGPHGTYRSANPADWSHPLARFYAPACSSSHNDTHSKSNCSLYPQNTQEHATVSPRSGHRTKDIAHRT